MSSKIIIKIKSLLEEINQIANEMTNVSNMVDGYFGVTHRKCGKPNCRCSGKEEKGHPFMRIVYSEQNKMKTKVIPQKDKEWIKKMTDNYRNYKQNFQKLRLCNKELYELLKKHELNVRTKTRGEKDYLKTT